MPHEHTVEYAVCSSREVIVDVDVDMDMATAVRDAVGALAADGARRPLQHHHLIVKPAYSQHPKS